MKLFKLATKNNLFQILQWYYKKTSDKKQLVKNLQSFAKSIDK